MDDREIVTMPEIFKSYKVSGTDKAILLQNLTAPRRVIQHANDGNVWTCCCELGCQALAEDP